MSYKKNTLNGEKHVAGSLEQGSTAQKKSMLCRNALQALVAALPYKSKKQRDQHQSELSTLLNIFEAKLPKYFDTVVYHHLLKYAFLFQMHAKLELSNTDYNALKKSAEVMFENWQEA